MEHLKHAVALPILMDQIVLLVPFQDFGTQTQTHVIALHQKHIGTQTHNNVNVQQVYMDQIV
jgi:hypothetical protein